MTSQSTNLPALSVEQRAEMLRAGAALMADQLGAALPDALAAALQDLAASTSGGAGAEAARRFLGSRREELRQGFLTRLKQAQSETLGRLFRRDKPGGSALKISADSLSLVEDDGADPHAVASLSARRIKGRLDNSLRELQVIVQYLGARDNVRSEIDPFAPDACMESLLDAARDLGLEAEGWGAFLGAAERPLTEALERIYRALIERFKGSRLEVGEIRRELATRQVAGRVAPGGAGAAAAGINAGGGPGGAGGGFGGVPGGGFGGVPGGGPGGGSGAGGPATISSPAGQRLAGLDDNSRFAGPPSVGPSASGGAQHTGIFAPPLNETPAETRAFVDSFLARMSSEAHGTPAPIFLPTPGQPPPDLLAAIDQMQQLGARVVAASPERGPATVRPSGAPPVIGMPVGGGPASGMPQGGAAGVALPASMPSIDQEEWRAELLAKSSRTVDKLTIEIVGMLFEHVLQDNQVPPEIKAVLSRLQFPVLKVALTDADFFASSAHPARRLIDRLASTAVGWEPYGDENQRYKAVVERIVQQVLERFDKDLGIFEQLLADFDTFIGEMPARETDPIARAKAALEEAERREVLVINTTIQVRRAFEHVELEPYLREFLVGPWVQALVSATLRDEQTPGFSKAFRQVIHDVIWSVQPKVSAEERKRLVTLIPDMTRVLRDGLAMVQMPEVDKDKFLKQLMASHAVAVRPVDQATYIKSKVATGDLRQKLDEMTLSASAPMAAAASGVHVSVNAVKRAAEKHAAELVIAEPLPGAAPTGFEDDAGYDAQIAGWQRGTWFSLYDGKETVKVKLRWISPLRTLFMFSGGEQKGARVLSPETIKSYLRQGWLKPLEDVPLMKRLVDRVVGEFERAPGKVEELAQKFSASAAMKPSRIGGTVAGG